MPEAGYTRGQALFATVSVYVYRARQSMVSQGARAVPVQAGGEKGEVHLGARGSHGRHHQLL